MTREELKQKAYEAYKRHISNGGFGSKFDFINGYIACANEHNQWHNVKDELPPANKDNPNYSIVVLVTDGEVIREAYCYLPTREWTWDGFTLIRVRYWTERLKLPKEG